MLDRFWVISVKEFILIIEVKKKMIIRKDYVLRFVIFKKILEYVNLISRVEFLDFKFRRLEDFCYYLMLYLDER